MNACVCDSSDEKMRDRFISKFLKKEMKDMSQYIRIVVCGAGDSGKSTIIRQMKLIHLGGFSKEERRNFMPSLIDNIVTYCYRVLKVLYNKLKPQGDVNTDT